MILVRLKRCRQTFVVREKKFKRRLQSTDNRNSLHAIKHVVPEVGPCSRIGVQYSARWAALTIRLDVVILSWSLETVIRFVVNYMCTIHCLGNFIC